ncbi:DJ-1/PfpI family protein [Sphingomonas sp. CFBP 8760]|uniref:DJ-1/PfpI family protein n=1 Tax=Sphingomonas sp. CFBP 8760 TaxID=2775282 RepID=UPI00177E24AC|nr:DJ-1/PfpI family protein [Sphingomonas sp. CFBP 8760]MBD8548578.1 DJ-1/PfpI family protein [Sphingomonas sp. CFBP 8760]
MTDLTAPFDRRQMLALASLGGAAAAWPASAQTAAERAAQPLPDPTAMPVDAPKIAMLVYPKMVVLDLIGPMTVFNMLRCNVQLVWKNKVPVSTDVRIPIAATQTFDEVPADVDVLFVPGGRLGTVDCMNDPAVMTFLADRGSRAKWVTSVCTGSLALAAAGLLKGYDATSHWQVADLLPRMGARHVDKRVVIDRNRMTGGGVTAGIDFGLTLAAHLKGEEAARRVQLLMEYAPEPPFRNGTPQEAGPTRSAELTGRTPWMDGQVDTAVAAAAKRLGIAG